MAAAGLFDLGVKLDCVRLLEELRSLINSFGIDFASEPSGLGRELILSLVSSGDVTGHAVFRRHGWHTKDNRRQGLATLTWYNLVIRLSLHMYTVSLTPLVFPHPSFPYYTLPIPYKLHVHTQTSSMIVASYKHSTLIKTVSALVPYLNKVLRLR
jgi:hypothetical protein